MTDRVHIVYTCIVNGYDVLMPPGVRSRNVRYICFTDDATLANRGWEIQPLQSPEELNRPDLINRYHKFFPHRILPTCHSSLYIDGNIRIVGDIEDYFRKNIEADTNFTLIKHPFRNSIQQESQRIIEIGKIPSAANCRLRQQLADYETEGLPLIPLTENNVLLRLHDEVLDKIMSDWWCQLETYVARDQISFPYIVWKHQVKVNYISDWNLRTKNPYFKIYKHLDNGLEGQLQQLLLKRRSTVWIFYSFLKVRKYYRKFIRLLDSQSLK